MIRARRAGAGPAAGPPHGILFVENGIGFGGAAVSLLNHLKVLDRSRFRPVVVTPRAGEGYRDLGDLAGWHVVPNGTVPPASLRRAFRLFGPASARLASWADYGVNLLPYVGRLTSIARREGVRLVVLNNDPVCNMGGLAAARLLGLPAVSFVRGTLWDARLTRFLLRRVDFFVPVSRYVREHLAGFGVPGGRMRVVRSIRDWDRFDPGRLGPGAREDLGLAPGDVAVGMLGLLIPWKGHRVFVDAAARVLAERPRVRFFVIGGEVDAFRGYRAELERLVRERGIGDRFRFLGHRPDVPRVVAGLDIMVHASTEPEPLGLVIAEGMVMEKPVIATDMGGPRELIEHGETGFLVAPGDPEALARAVVSLVDDPGLRRRTGEAGRRWVLENLSREGETAKLVEIYERMIAGRARGRRGRTGPRGRWD